nr:hypothetical protein [uncultured Oscillibacter sp.]
MNKQALELPRQCYAVMPGDGRLLVITRGECGYRHSPLDTGNRTENRFIADQKNAEFGGVTPEQERLMIDGSIFGWDLVYSRIAGKQYRARHFIIELSSPSSSFAHAQELVLPADDYTLLDAFEQLHLSPGERPYTEIISYSKFDFLSPLMKEDPDPLRLNHLLRRLDSMDLPDQEIFKALVQMENEKTPQERVSVDRFIDLAYSTDCCDIHLGITSDEQLGRIYAENGFMPDLDDLPEKLFESLNFRQIGREEREREHGIFTAYGYVIQNTEPKPISQTLDYALRKPDYMFRIGVKNYPIEGYTHIDTDTVAYLNLPASEQQFQAVLDQLGNSDWLGTVLDSFESILPDFKGAVISTEDLPELNDLARYVQEIDASGQLTKYKAVLSLLECPDISSAITAAEHLDEYILDSQCLSAQDYAEANLLDLLDDSEAELLLPNVNLWSYGKTLMQNENAVLTPYGTLSRQDGQPVQAPVEQPWQGGMEMM